MQVMYATMKLSTRSTLYPTSDINMMDKGTKEMKEPLLKLTKLRQLDELGYEFVICNTTRELTN